MPEDDKYDVLEKIGHGSFGIIRKVKRKSDGYILCRKEISYLKMSQKEREQLQSELSILKELRHPNIVAYFERDHIKASQDLHLYMEYCGNGDLGRVIRDLKNKNQVCEEEFVWSIFSQIVSALYRCHYGEDPPAAGRNVMGLVANAKPVRDSRRPMILHRDLKPENIFLGDDNSVKLGDFGLSKILQSHDFASTYVGTPFYMSPEICKAEQYGPHSDIWALGCIIYEMCAKTPPFNAKTHFELIQKIKLGRYPDIPACYSAELRKVIASCLQTTPDHRPDTAALLNLPIVKLMRKEQEVVKLGQDLREQKMLAARREKEANEGIGRIRKEIDDQLRREWELKARLEIERQVKVQTEQRVQRELAQLQSKFEEEVNKRVEAALKKYPNRLSTSPKLAPRSNTPLMPATEQGALFPTDLETAIMNGSQSTVDTNSDFASGTDMSSLSLDDSTEDVTVKAKPKRASRAPLSRARTMFAQPASPMDVQMADLSPAPASLAGLSLSPRRNQQPRQNIFAAAKEGAKKWEAEVPPSPTDAEWNGDFDDDDDLPVLPSPTRTRSASGGRLGGEDPFKALANAQAPLLKANHRLGSTPNLHAPKASKPRPASAVPIVATSPSRPKSKSADALSTSPRKTGLAAKSAPSVGLPTKRGNEAIRIQAMRNNGGIQGRTLVELQQARGIPAQAMSEDEGKKGFGFGRRSPVKGRSAGTSPPAVWDPDTELEMPSPFIVRNKRMVR
ncbi:G2-specific protein kinase-like protein nimA [Cucurbitaria berberidis CBS 394.84]|uniref:non-specific serine/threonine protein kinase n=1 Tax=Cucurbitaria berberidis CBS 394.84 TaxID=1168544 RepID=A0A9P4GSS5_9PLEO|nr:G2-specific protein kinase-like protein nimA [Cucurbitaria berberidis CBS 394.84]KAF1852093.1 G2-specific protein kinase-like protein nimA [Cucurbitaria berberidis CBS 394.84]